MLRPGKMPEQRRGCEKTSLCWFGVPVIATMFKPQGVSEGAKMRRSDAVEIKEDSPCFPSRSWNVLPKTVKGLA